MKTCSTCNQEKPDTDFYSGRRKCKECFNSVRRDKYNGDPEFRTKRARQIQDYKYNREKSDPEFRLRRQVSHRIRQTLREQGKSKLLFDDYQIDVTSIYKKLGPKPSDEYELEHHFPVSCFDFSDKFQVWACNHPDNLSWMLSKENLEKRAKFDQVELDKYLEDKRSDWTQVST